MIIESFRFDYDYETRHFWRQLLASSRADVIVVVIVCLRTSFEENVLK